MPIQASHMRAYLLLSGCILLLLLAIALPISYAGIGQCVSRDANSCGLFRFQERKVAAAATPIDTVFFGDSSLGNAIDNRLFSSLLGKPTISLALNGSMGLPVIYLQMKSVFEQRQVRNAVIMLSPEGYRHHFEKGADPFVEAGKTEPETFFGVSPLVALDSVASLVNMLFDSDILRAGFDKLFYGEEINGECRGCDSLDYVEQTNKHVQRGIGDMSTWNGPYSDYDPFLRLMASLCRRHHVNCVYMHGPLMQDVMDLNPGYVTKVDAKLAKAGLPLVAAQPIPIPTDEVGNAVNHVRPELRPVYTQRIYAALQPYLEPSGKQHD
ncbi:MAG: hypothetical protein ABWY00_15670 [Dongiaceae bacterium]